MIVFVDQINLEKFENEMHGGLQKNNLPEFLFFFFKLFMVH